VLAVSTAGLFDGFRVDAEGRVWASTDEGVPSFEPDGTLIGKILIPEIVANVTFGSAITCSSAAGARSIRRC
jgi:gluconolactonase